ncbi:MAG TPA: helix-turn-helix transcriptional regulator [Kribbella sp.]|uniref:helix-turn-helix transcriptional regulator n=1 Tax=Kribbella sp. TaxID=1871183 RepID=UPI002D77E366|nr:helix-turn-helix transcriptional regulator [Kribbella sp.]HET6295771.1 helix-turn-helix transcriptional regulator [Kribbella sp.]
MTVRPQLGEFLQTRRARVRPEEVGLPTLPDRRVTGLRREEVAMLANVSVDYYVRLEQGRAAHPSPAVLAAVATALRLSDTERDHLQSLASPPARSRPAPAEVRPAITALIESLRDTPAVLVDRLSNVLAWNPAAAALITDFGALEPAERNIARLYFLDPSARTFYEDWAGAAKDVVAHLRHASTDYADDPDLADLVAELSARSCIFAEWWTAQDVSKASHCPKVLNHPAAGRLTLTLEVLELPGDNGQTLMTYTPADHPTKAALTELLTTLA